MSDNKAKLVEIIKSMQDKDKGVLWTKLQGAALAAKLDPKELDNDLMELIDEGSVVEPKVGYLKVNEVKTEEKQEEAYIPSVEPRSVCTCKHNGDGVGSEHDSDPVTNHAGLGPCKMAGCPCMEFRFDHFLEKYATRSGKPTPASKKSVEETVKKLARAKRKKDLEASGVIPPEKAPEAPAAPAPIGTKDDIQKVADLTSHPEYPRIAPEPQGTTPMAVSVLGASPALDSDIHTPAQADQAAGRIIDEAQNMTPKQMKAAVEFAEEHGVGTIPLVAKLAIGKKRGRKPKVAGVDVKVDPEVPPGIAVLDPIKEAVLVSDKYSLHVPIDPKVKEDVARAKALLANAGYTVGTLKEKVYQVFDLHRDKDSVERSLKIKLANGQRLDIIIHKKRGFPVSIIYPMPGALDLKTATRFARGCLKATDLAEEMEEEVGE